MGLSLPEASLGIEKLSWFILDFHEHVIAVQSRRRNEKTDIKIKRFMMKIASLIEPAVYTLRDPMWHILWMRPYLARSVRRGRISVPRYARLVYLDRAEYMSGTTANPPKMAGFMKFI